MIVQNLVLIVAIAVPVLLLVLLRANAAVVFLSLCAGSLLVRFIGDDANLVGSAVANNSHIVSQYSEIVLLFLPVLLAIFITRKSVPASKLLFNVIAAVAFALLAVVLTVPLLPAGAQHVVVSTQGWKLLEHNKSLVVGAGVLASLIVLWIVQPRPGKRHHH
jgi:hypothetical protein